MDLDSEEKYHILATQALSLSGVRVLKHGDSFAVFDSYGDIRPARPLGALGLYHDGARFLSELRLTVSGQRLLLLSSTVRENNVLVGADLMNPDLIVNGHLAVPHGSLHVFRAKFLLDGACYEHLQISNYDAMPIEVDLSIRYSADFVDLFEVRGTARERRGTLHPPERHDRAAILSYTGLDAVRRVTRLSFAPAPDRQTDHEAMFHVRLEAKQTKDIYLTISCEGNQEPVLRASYENAYAQACADLRRFADDECDLRTSNEQFNDWIQRSRADLRMMITDTEHGPYPYAGVPWFSTPFGRDGIITALEALWFNPELAKGVLKFLAATQATELDPASDAQPGKMIHEMRDGEMARLSEVPFRRYYGSVDSTPLFVMLAAAYYKLSGDLPLIRDIWLNIERALDWISRYGDPDGDGFIEYMRSAPEGLLQQGWKDSNDSIFHADGSDAVGPTALCEVQGYVYGAFLGGAELASQLGYDERATSLRRAAEELRTRFDQVYWCEELGMYALALDCDNRPCRVRSSNAGQCLWSGIALPERARSIAEKLLSREMFSGWGIRTIASDAPRYNPVSYHNGSVWPHDNALIASGLARYNLKQHAIQVLSALFDASLFVDLHRLPELYCGFARRPGDAPTLYPVACSPQAWAAPVPFMILSSLLGMSIDGAAGRVCFTYPTLPSFLEEVELRNLRVGSGTVDLVLHRHPEDVGINVIGRRGAVEVVVIK